MNRFLLASVLFFGLSTTQAKAEAYATPIGKHSQATLTVEIVPCNDGSDAVCISHRIVGGRVDVLGQAAPALLTGKGKQTGSKIVYVLDWNGSPLKVVGTIERGHFVLDAFPSTCGITSPISAWTLNLDPV